MELHYQQTGQGKPLIILHGLFGMSDNWISIGRGLGENFNVYIPDLRNHGRSPHHDVFNYAAMVDDLLEFMESHKLDTSYLLGHSMGGKVAMQFVLDYPEKVDKLIVADISPDAYDHSHDNLIDALLSVDLQQYQSRQQIRNALKEQIPDERIIAFLLKNLHWKNRHTLGWKANLGVIRDNMEEVFRAISSPGSFTKPTLFIKGGRSRYITDDHLPAIKRLFPNYHLETIQDASHWLHAEKPERFMEVVGKFLG